MVVQIKGIFATLEGQTAYLYFDLPDLKFTPALFSFLIAIVQKPFYTPIRRKSDSGLDVILSEK